MKNHNNWLLNNKFRLQVNENRCSYYLILKRIKCNKILNLKQIIRKIFNYTYNKSNVIF